MAKFYILLKKSVFFNLMFLFCSVINRTTNKETDDETNICRHFKRIDFRRPLGYDNLMVYAYRRIKW